MPVGVSSSAGAPAVGAGMDPASLRALCSAACSAFLVGGKRDRASLVATLVREKSRVSKETRAGGGRSNDSCDALYSLSLCLKRVEKTLGFHECRLWNEVRVHTRGSVGGGCDGGRAGGGGPCVLLCEGREL